MRTRVKICGLTRIEDALAAVAAGADALGFMFYAGSPRHVTPEQVLPILRALPPFVSRVGVFVNSPALEVEAITTTCGLDTLQFHGDESPAFCQQFQRWKVYKAFRVQDTNSLAQLPAFATDAWLLDSFVPDKLGGTGARFNWDLAVAAKQHGRPIILAGGLTPENAAAAVRKVRPYALDVSSGVESSPGQKDPAKITALLAAVRAADASD